MIMTWSSSYNHYVTRQTKTWVNIACVRKKGSKDNGIDEVDEVYFWPSSPHTFGFLTLSNYKVTLHALNRCWHSPFYTEEAYINNWQQRKLFLFFCYLFVCFMFLFFFTIPTCPPHSVFSWKEGQLQPKVKLLLHSQKLVWQMKCYVSGGHQYICKETLNNW